jgi:lincosamide and streptogramin A transport system ATP-binding/permease protein
MSPLTDYKKTNLVEVKDLAIKYADRIVTLNINFSINIGDRVSLCGRNGSGKSSILKLILGEHISYEGKLNIGSNLIISYVPQDSGFLKGDLSEFAKKENIDESRFKTLLNKLDFSKMQFEKDMSELSSGQKKKVLLAKSLCESAHLYIWDEPLNYIDIFSRMQIEELILKYKPTLLFVEHDMSFNQNIATKIIQI